MPYSQFIEEVPSSRSPRWVEGNVLRASAAMPAFHQLCAARSVDVSDLLKNGVSVEATPEEQPRSR